MSTVVRPELSVKNPYWISRERYYELKHFCMQYHDYILKRVECMEKAAGSSSVIHASTSPSFDSNKTLKAAETLEESTHYIDIIDKCCEIAGDDICFWLHKAVTEGKSYATLNPPCCKDYFYERYRKFYWMLDKVR